MSVFTAMAVGRTQHLPIRLDIVEEDPHTPIEISGLYAHKPGEGAGSKTMDILTELADERAEVLEVFCGIEADGSDPVRLIRFYARWGFVLMNPGWRGDCFDRPHMVRQPKKVNRA